MPWEPVPGSQKVLPRPKTGSRKMDPMAHAAPAANARRVKPPVSGLTA